jgi:hypothetical protein
MRTILTPAAWLRVTSIVAVLQFAGHGFLFLTASPKHGAEEVAVVEAMKAHRFAFGGSMRSYWDFYFGYGIEAAFVCLVEAILLWQLAAISLVNPRAVRPTVALLLLANLGHLALVGRYFFITPGLFDGAIAAGLGLVLVATDRRGHRPAPVSA